MRRPDGSDPWQWLRENPEEEGIYIHSEIITGERFDVLVAAQLSDLELVQCTITAEAASRFAELETVVWLELKKCSNTANALQGLKTCSQLFINWVEVEEDTDQFMDAIRNHPTVTGLGIHNPSRNPEDYFVFETVPKLTAFLGTGLSSGNVFSALSQCKRLQALTLFGDYSPSAIDIQNIAYLPWLEQLTLGLPNLSDDHLRYLVGHAKLENLLLPGVHLTDETLLLLIENPALGAIYHRSPLVSNKVMKSCPARRKALGLKRCPVHRWKELPTEETGQ